MPGYWPTGRCKTERKSSRKRPSVVYVRCVARSTTLVASRLPLLLSSTSRENARGKKRTSPPLRPLDLLLYSALSLRLWRRGSFVFRLPFPTHFTFASSHLHSDYGCSNLFIPAFFLSFFLSPSLSFFLLRLSISLFHSTFFSLVVSRCRLVFWVSRILHLPASDIAHYVSIPSWIRGSLNARNVLHD